MVLYTSSRFQLFVHFLLSLAFLRCPCDAKKAVPLHEKHKKFCNGQPTITRKHEKGLQWLFKNIGEPNLLSSISPQHEAACWMFRQGKSFSPQRYVMAVIYYGTKGAKWDSNNDWMTSKHECSWYGVKCNSFSTVVELDLGYIKVDGLIPREIGLLKELTDLDLHGNDLQGVIPHKLMVGMKKLEYMRLQMNGFFGAIHKEIKHMSNMRELYLFGNYIAGTIPKELAELKKLEVLDLYANQLSGTIPKELAKLPRLSELLCICNFMQSLRIHSVSFLSICNSSFFFVPFLMTEYLDLHDNNLVGTMPREICERKLDALIADCHGLKPEVKCDCCTVCCEGLPVMACYDQKTGKKVVDPI